MKQINLSKQALTAMPQHVFQNKQIDLRLNKDLVLPAWLSKLGDKGCVIYIVTPEKAI